MLEGFFNFTETFLGSSVLLWGMFFFIISLLRETCGVRSSVKWHILFGFYRMLIHTPLMMVAANSTYTENLWIKVLYYVSYFVGVVFGYLHMLNYVYKGKLVKIFFIGFFGEFISGIIPLMGYSLLYSGAKLLNVSIGDGFMTLYLMLVMIGVTLGGIRLFGPFLKKVRQYEMDNILTWAVIIYGVGHSVIENLRMIIADSYHTFFVTTGINTFFELGYITVFVVFVLVVLVFIIMRKRLMLLRATKDRMMNWYDDIMQNGVKVEVIENDMETALREVLRENSIEGRKESLKNYCERLQASYEKMKGNLYCRDYMVDATLADCVRKCQASGIDTQIHFQTYDRGELNELTICYIITQCFEAVIEATRGNGQLNSRPMVDLKAMKAKDMIVFEMVYEQGDGQKIDKRPFRQMQRQLENTVLKKNGFIRTKTHKGRVEVMISIS